MATDDQELEIPPFFVCPISLDMMKDPVTVPTGITYEREFIEKWVFAQKNQTCPVTKLPLSVNVDLTPNHTLRRLIQSWCAINVSRGVERFPTPKPLASKSQISKLIHDHNSKSADEQIKCLKKLKSIAAVSDANKRCIETAGGAEFAASLITLEDSSELVVEDEYIRASDEALSMLHLLELSDPFLKSLATDEFITALTRVMRDGCYDSRVYAVMILKSITEVANTTQMTGLKPELFTEIVQLLKDEVTPKATRAGLHVLINVSPVGRSRLKAVEAGSVHVLIDMLLDSSEKRVCEMALTVLDQLCQCAEGRAEVLCHGAGMAIVSKKILRVSKVGSERASRVLHSLAKYSGSPVVLHEMMEAGVVAKLCLVLQVDSGARTKERAREILKMHAITWKNTKCLPLALFSSYP
ncbi:E3 ubiquitin-protein ligase PUB23-like [Impatiens glandulifera]|uniref:E3 ubiquitin-protein ligase PUB23-like n=1 Tax=Impatiens glandulifera TaxID=253017 RepID=UPI001FB18119|nr:E3 ubiquitin-protein ligase PUB23-like [Impatiens glandulifera]